MATIDCIKEVWDKVLVNSILHFEWAGTNSHDKKQVDKNTIMHLSLFIEVFSCLFLGHHMA
jgi:hypothetical protein